MTRPWLRAMTIVIIIALAIGLGGCGSKSETGTTGETDTTSENPKTAVTTLSDILSKGKTAQGMYFNYLMTLDGQETMKGEMWVQGNKLKMVGTAQGQNSTFIIDGDKKVSYMLMGDTAMKSDYQSASDQFSTPGEYVETLDTTKVTELETKLYDGAMCRVISVKDPVNNSDMKMYIREDYGIPVRIESTTDGKPMVIEYKNVTLGDQPANVFELPPGVKVQDISGLMNSTGIPSKP